MSLDLATLRDVLAGVSADDLRHLAAAKEAQGPQETAWARLTDKARNEGMAMLASAVKPGLGWWRGNLPSPSLSPGCPPLPPAHLLAGTQTRGWAPWELVAAAVSFGDDGVAEDVAQDVLASLASRHGLTADDLADAYTVLEESA